MLAGGDGGFQMGRPEVRRRGENHDVDAAVDQFLIGIEAAEMMIFGDGDLVAGFLLQLLGELVQAVFDFVFERIGHRHQLDVLIGVQGIVRRPGAAAAAADEAQLQRIVARRVNRSGKCQAAGQCAGGDRGGFQKLTARSGVWVFGRHGLVSGPSWIGG